MRGLIINSVCVYNQEMYKLLFKQEVYKMFFINIYTYYNIIYTFIILFLKILNILTKFYHLILSDSL